MMWTLLIAVALATGNEVVVDSGTVWAQAMRGEAGGAVGQSVNDTMKSEDVRAVVTEDPTLGLDSSALAAFDQCRAKIDLKRPVDQVKEEVTRCKTEARSKGKKLAHPNFEDIKSKLQQQGSQ